MMSRTPIENHASLRIGVVEFVAPDEIKVQLDLEAPDGIAANAGVPREFPRINSYVLIPNEGGHIVCQVEWIAVERSPFPKRKGYQDYGLIDLPFPIRKIKLTPLGILRMSANETFKFQRGVHSFPSIGSPVLIPTDLQLKSIVESGSNRRVYIGNSPLAANAEVKIDPDRLFGRHLAVLGNTGSGKSCTVAGLIQWSLEATERGDNANARFVILDPNGEYGKVFGEKAKVLKVGSDKDTLEVPLWMWNSEEWRSFTQAKPGAQLPLLKRALRAMRNEELEFQTDPNLRAKRFVGIMLQSVVSSENNGEPFKQFPHSKNFTERIITWKTSLESFDLENTQLLEQLIQIIEALVAAHKVEQNSGWVDYPIYTAPEIEEFIDQIRETYSGLGGNEKELYPKNEDIPIPFKGDTFLNYLEALAQETGNEQYLEFLIARIRTMLSDSRMDAVIGDKIDIQLDKWLEKYLGTSDKTSITIIDQINKENERISKGRNLLLAGAIEADDFQTIKAESTQTINSLENRLYAIKEEPKIAIDALLDRALDVVCNIDKLYEEADVEGKRKIIGSIYPENLTYSDHIFRTGRMNEAFKLIYQIDSELGGGKKSTKPTKSALYNKVGPPGLEPGTF